MSIILDSVLISTSTPRRTDHGLWTSIVARLKPEPLQEQDKNPSSYAQQQIYERWENDRHGRLTKFFKCKNANSANNLADAFEEIKKAMEKIAGNHPKMQDSYKRGIVVNLREDHSVRVDFLSQSELDITREYLKFQNHSNIREILYNVVEHSKI